MLGEGRSSPFMEAAAGRGGSLAVPSSSQRKEWRAVPEHCFRSNGSGVGITPPSSVFRVWAGVLSFMFCWAGVGTREIRTVR